MSKVAIDISPLESFHRFRGVGIYTRNLVEAFKNFDTEGIKIEPVNFKKLSKARLTRSYSLLHYPYFEPFFLSLPLRKKIPTVVTVHDLIPLVFPKHFPKGIKGWFKWQIQKFSLKGVVIIITDSKNSGKDIIKFLKIPKEKIRVVHLAPGTKFRRLERNDEFLIKTKQKYHLPEQFVLYVGDLNWNKNVNGMLKAFHKLKAQSSKLKATTRNLKLVLIGKAFEDKSLPELINLKKLIKSLELEKEVVTLGFVSLEDLVAIYNQATVYSQPSFYEGFGLPVLEAMACGCPVVCAKAASLSEIAGEAAIYVNPKNPKDIAEGINKVLSFTKADYQKVVEKSLKQAKKFSWQRTAKETLKAYQKALAHER